jgi:hypothetical protein
MNYAQQPKPMSSYAYRQYLISNAESMIDHERAKVDKQNACTSCDKDADAMMVQQPVIRCNKRVCTFAPNHPQSKIDEPFLPWDGNYATPYKLGS